MKGTKNMGFHKSHTLDNDIRSLRRCNSDNMSTQLSGLNIYSGTVLRQWIRTSHRVPCHRSGVSVIQSTSPKLWPTLSKNPCRRDFPLHKTFCQTNVWCSLSDPKWTVFLQRPVSIHISICFMHGLCKYDKSVASEPGYRTSTPLAFKWRSSWEILSDEI